MTSTTQSAVVLAEDIAEMYESASIWLPDAAPEARCLDLLFEAIAVLASTSNGQIGPSARRVLGS